MRAYPRIRHSELAMGGGKEDHVDDEMGLLRVLVQVRYAAA